MLQLAQGAKRLAGELTTQTHAELKATICKLVQQVGLSTESIAVQIRLNGLYDLVTAGKSKAKLNLPSDATSTINSPL